MMTPKLMPEGIFHNRKAMFSFKTVFHFIHCKISRENLKKFENIVF